MIATVAALLSRLMGQTPEATVDTIYEVNKLARKATAWARTPLKIHAHQSPVVTTYTDAGWTTRQTALHKVTVGLHCKLRVAARQRIKLVSDILHSSRLRRVARSSSAAETQAAADGEDEAVYIRLCLGEVLFGQLDLQNWQPDTRQNSCCFGGGLSWCVRRLVLLFAFLSWSEGQEIWPGGTCAQTESR